MQMREYIVTVGTTHPALVIVGESYDKDTAPDSEAVREVLQDTEWGLSGVISIQQGPVEIQHEQPPTEPYDAYGVVVVFEQSPTQAEYDWDGPFRDAERALHEAFDDIEIWIDAVSNQAP